MSDIHHDLFESTSISEYLWERLEGEAYTQLLFALEHVQGTPWKEFLPPDRMEGELSRLVEEGKLREFIKALPGPDAARLYWSLEDRPDLRDSGPFAQVNWRGWVGSKVLGISTRAEQGFSTHDEKRSCGSATKWA